MSKLDALPQLIHELGEACGFELTLVEGSIFADGPFFSATARSPGRSSTSRVVILEAVAEIYLSHDDAGRIEWWALVFLFVNGQRVAPPGMCHLTLKLEPGDDGASRWVAKGWEADVYEEWTELESLDRE